jgi:hypothetical protein
VRLTQRDVEVVSFMGEQYGVRKDQLPQLVGGVSERTIRALIDRWVRAGLINRRTIFAGDHAWLWPTREGLELSGDPLPYWEPRPGILEHVYWVNEVRFRVAAKHPGSSWISERRLRAEAGGANRPEHMPDGLVLKAGKQIAIEVQLAQKSRDRSVASLAYLTETYDGAWVFARAGGPAAAVELAIGSLAPDRAKQVRLLPLEESA